MIEIDMEALRKAADMTLKIDPEAVVMRLEEWAVRYAEAARGPRFAVGDLVTPSKDCKYGGAGAPHRVIQTRIVCTMNHQPRICSCSQDDMRIIGISASGDVVSAWAESAMFEKWVGEA